MKSNNKNIKDYIIQKEIKPLLTTDGKKFAIRAHVAIILNNDKYEFQTWFHKQCIVLPNAKYYDPHNIKDKTIHIQNIGKKLPKACLLDNAYCLSMKKNVDDIYQQMFNITYKVFKCVTDDIMMFQRNCSKNDIMGKYYHIFGFDFMIDKDENVLLLEINAFPAIGNGTMTHVDKNIFTDLIKDLMSVIFSTVRNNKYGSFHRL